VVRDRRRAESGFAHPEHLAGTYWRPVYAYFRRRWGRSNEEANDLTQRFFLSLAEGAFPRELSPERGRFRTYVMVSLDNFARMDHRERSCLKRGGGLQRLSPDALEGFEPPSDETPEQVFHREWRRSVLERATDDLEREYRGRGRGNAFDLFLAYDIDASVAEGSTYEDLARRFGVSVAEVTNILYRARRDLRERVLSVLRETGGSGGEAEAELLDLFGD